MNGPSRPLTRGTPPAEIEVDEVLVRGLLEEQFPDLCPLPLQPVEAGWDNFLFRLGDRLAVRLPRRKASAPNIEIEQRWLPGLASMLPIPVPAPCGTGVQGGGYPWRWSVIPWIPGHPADLWEPAVGQAGRLAGFLRALHVAAPPDAPRNPFRGVPLRVRKTTVEERMQRVAGQTDLITGAVRRAWSDALDASEESEVRWLHGDLHARNVLVESGEITGIIDWGDLTAGDVATDLASAWMLFGDQGARREMLAGYGSRSDALLIRARGWAVLFGVLLTDTGLVDHPRHAVMGERTLRRITEDANQWD